MTASTITTTGAEHPHAPDSVPALDASGGKVFRTSVVFGVTGLVLFFVLALTGVAMRMNQAEWIELTPTWFYRLMTIHGAGMFVAMLMSMMGAFYYALSPTIAISRASMAWSYVLVLGGAVLAIVAVMFGGFAGAWTFLFPLPFVSVGGWETWSAITFLVAMVAISLGWGVFFFEVLDRIVTRFGSIADAMGLKYLFGRSDTPPPPTVVGACTVAIVALGANMVGATIVIAQLVYGADRSTEIGMLWAKNTTYSFGHTIMNLLIYLAAVMLYTVIPRYTGRQWKTTKPLISAWLLTFVAVSAAYTHHLYMDFVQPAWASVVGQVASSAAAIPVAVITVYTGVLLSWGSRYRWTLASGFVYLGFAGWLTGGIAAVADSLIAVNMRFHNTLWVPAHFHSYLLLGVMVWSLAFMVHLLERAAGQPAAGALAKSSVAMIVLGGYAFVGAWYVSGARGVPRRWAVQPDGAQLASSVATIAAIVLLVGVLLSFVQMVRLAKIARMRHRDGVASSSGSDAGREPAAAVSAGEAGSAKIAAFDGRLGGVPGLALAMAGLVVALSPPLKEWSETSVAAHHVVHALQFGGGGIAGLWLGSTMLLRGTIGRAPRSLAALLVMLMQSLMMALMAPAVYRSVEQEDLTHFLFHIFLAGLGVAAGVAASRFGRFTAWYGVLLGVFGALLWAAGVQ